MYFTRTLQSAMLLLLSFFAMQPLPAQTLYAILAGDLSDPAIGNSCSLDLERMDNTFSKLAMLAGYEYQPNELSNAGFCTESVLEAIRRINCNSDDVIAVYYSGHGFRTPGQVSEWPVLKLGSRGQSRQQWATPLETILDQLRSKSAITKIMIADACNATGPVALPPPPAADNIDLPKQRENIRRLLDSRGLFIMVAAKSGNYAYCNEQQGGFFTRIFCQALWKSVGLDDRSDWAEIAEMARGHTLYYTQNRQEPFFESLKDSNPR